MFLSQRERRKETGGQALTGPVTVPGDRVGAYVEGERREMAVYAPGGYHWVPALGDEVLVLKAGERGERPCVVAAAMGEAKLEPGEVLLSANGTSILLGRDGEVRISGEVRVDGALLVNGRPVMTAPEEG